MKDDRTLVASFIVIAMIILACGPRINVDWESVLGKRDRESGFDVQRKRHFLEHEGRRVEGSGGEPQAYRIKFGDRIIANISDNKENTYSEFWTSSNFVYGTRYDYSYSDHGGLATDAIILFRVDKSGEFHLCSDLLRFETRFGDFFYSEMNDDDIVIFSYLSNQMDREIGKFEISVSECSP